LGALGLRALFFVAFGSALERGKKLLDLGVIEIEEAAARMAQRHGSLPGLARHGVVPALG